ncbi:MAG: hypothetical protein IJK87_01360 [Prevotella sp.]|nr:hypothetical protein [Prevotella sp.]
MKNFENDFVEFLRIAHPINRYIGQCILSFCFMIWLRADTLICPYKLLFRCVRIIYGKGLKAYMTTDGGNDLRL